MSGGNMHSDALYAWPTADVSFMAPEAAAKVGRALSEALARARGPKGRPRTRQAVIGKLAQNI
jgi:acetyl-CoA carboxylase carboxyltransferase component